MTIDSGKSKTEQRRWVRSYVDIFEHEMFAGEPYSPREAFLWLIANAAWKPRRVNHKGGMVDLGRGQLIGARSFLAETWGWGEQKVRTFLNRLQSEGMVIINQSNGHFANVITVCNYSKYQEASDRKNQSDNQSLTSAQPEPNQTLRKDNRDINNNKNTPTASVESEAAREPVTVLAGPEALLTEMIQSVMAWGAMPDLNARNWLRTTVSTFGREATARAYQKLKTDLATGQLIAHPLRTWGTIAARLKGESDRAASAPRKPTIRELLAESAA